MRRFLALLLLMFLLTGCTLSGEAEGPLTDGVPSLPPPGDPATMAVPRAPRIAPPASPAEPRTVTALLYHHLLPEAAVGNGATISVAQFEREMAWLKENGYTALSAADLARWLDGKGEVPPKAVLITFDDGYQSVYQYAFPVLKRHDLKAAVFVITSLIGQTQGDLTYLSAGELKEMAESGLVEVQAHSHGGHQKLSGGPALVVWSEAEIRSDLKQVRQAFADAGLYPPTAYAYPFGAYDQETLSALAADGLVLGFTVRGGVIRQGDQRLQLNRRIIFPGTGLCAFARILGAASAECR